MKRLLATVVTAAALVVNLTPVAQAAGCPSVNRNWAGPGPYAVTSASNGQGTTIIRPAQLGTLGCAKHPVILWSNGAAATVSTYQPLLEHFASHGFIVAAGEGRSSSATLRGASMKMPSAPARMKRSARRIASSRS